MDPEATVSLDGYWSYIGVPYFFVLVLFIIYVILNTTEPAMSTINQLKIQLQGIQKSVSAIDRGRAAAAKAAAPASTSS